MIRLAWGINILQELGYEVKIEDSDILIDGIRYSYDEATKKANRISRGIDGRRDKAGALCVV